MEGARQGSCGTDKGNRDISLNSSTRINVNHLDVGLGIGRNLSPSQNSNGLMPLPPVYKLRDENYFRLNLQSRHMKVVKTENAEIETVI